MALPAAPGGLALGLLEALEGLSRQRLLDRLIRGRAWIGLVAFALIGIVAMQLWVVKLGVGIGRALEHAALLQRENSTLAIEDSALSSSERIEQLAAAKGMVLAPPGALHFDPLRGPLDARLAAAALARPLQATGAPISGGEATGQSAGGEAASTNTTAGATGTSASASLTPAAGSSEAQSGVGTGVATGTTATGPASESAPTGTPAAAAEGATGAGASATGAPAAAAAPASAPARTGGSSEAAGAPAGSGGGTGAPQSSPGG